jgi:Uma2 family endonuclease
MPYISEEEYLASEELSEVRREYIDGQVFPMAYAGDESAQALGMAGATDSHNILTGNVFARLHARLRGSECRAYVNDIKAQVKAAKAYYYPAVMVSCGARNPQAVASETPVLIIEVLSPSTATTDRREKLLNYRKLPTLREYVLIEQDEQRVEVYRLNEQHEWVHEILADAGVLELRSLPDGVCSISLEDIYESVIFTPPDESPEDA